MVTVGDIRKLIDGVPDSTLFGEMDEEGNIKVLNLSENPTVYRIDDKEKVQTVLVGIESSGDDSAFEE